MLVSASPGHIQSRLQQAISAHQRGKLGQAEAIYKEILAIQPEHFDALHLLGTIALQKGYASNAVELIGRAIDIDSSNAAAHSNLASALLGVGQAAEALVHLDTAIQLKPDYLDALFNRGNALRELNRPLDALAAIDSALSLEPRDAELHYNKSVVLITLGRSEDALECANRALLHKPDYAAAFFMRGNAQRRLYRYPEAVASYEAAIRLKPAYAEALNNLGLLMIEMRRPADALIYIDRALELRADYIEAICNRSCALVELDRPEEALACAAQALSLDENLVDALCNQGNALRKLDRHAEAHKSFERALELQPGSSQVLSDRGLLWMDLNRHDLASECFAQACIAEPGAAKFRWNAALSHLAQGNLAEGWSCYEARWELQAFTTKKRAFPQPRWQGGALEGKTILVHAEQGFGDTLQFARYAKLLADDGANVILEVQPALKQLFVDLAWSVEVVGAGESLPHFDCHCPLMSLPLAFNTRLDTVPTFTSYVSAHPAKRDLWEARLGPRQKPRVGLVWAGNPAQANDRNRSTRLELLADLLARDDVQFISLQKEVRAADQALLDHYSEVIQVAEQLKDFSDTAALIECLDLVISVDTSVAHLAAAMGKPTWLMLTFSADWRWLKERDDSPWYPTVRLFRQPDISDWDGLVKTVSGALDAWLLTVSEEEISA